jgi:Zn-dependent protease
MNNGAWADAVITYFGFIAFVTFHEFAHAWAADRLGDDTPRSEGRVTLDPLAHVDLIGTIILPLILLAASASSGHVMFFGWGKPVMINPNNFRRRRVDDILVSVAGPFMNLWLGFVMLGIMKLGTLAGISFFEKDELFHLVGLTLFLCFFNLLPIPPLDGGHIFRNLIGISDIAYAQISQYSFLFFILVMRSGAISQGISQFTDHVLFFLAGIFGWHLGYD